LTDNSYIKKLLNPYSMQTKMSGPRDPQIHQINDIAVIKIAMAIMKAIILSSTCNILSNVMLNTKLKF